MSDNAASGLDADIDALVGKFEKNDTPIIGRGKNARSDIVVDGYRFDSNEELDFYYWVTEAQGLGFVDSFAYQPPSFVLFPGLKNERGKFAIREHVYTADFRIEFSDLWAEFRKANGIKAFDRFDERTVYVDVKGGFNRFGGDREFSVNQKWTFAKFGVYVWKIKPFEFFHKKAWLPKKAICTRKTGKVRSKYLGVKVFEKHGYVFPDVGGPK